VTDVQVDTACGNCGHPSSEHPETDELIARTGLVVGGPWWSCVHMEDGVECMCADYAVPGTILNIGRVSMDPGDPEKN